MPNTWIAALKAWNASKKNKNWCVPKKGTAGYRNVKRLMKKGNAPKVKEEPKSK